MNSSKLSSLLFTLSWIFISQASGHALYEQVCADTKEDQNCCLNLLKTEPQITTATKDFELCQLILELGIKKATEAQDHIKEIMKTNPSPAIKECATFDYDGVVASFKSSLGELTLDTMTSNYDAKTAGDGPTTCDTALANAKIHNPVLSTLNREIMLLSKIAFLATNRLPVKLSG